jgi:ligand-binding sensor domain-containing protein/signal transduction histidine kinase
MKICSFLSAACLVLGLAAAGRAQPGSLDFDRLTTLDGLSQDIVTCVHRDGAGFLWIGTEDGLNRYDGYSIRSYKHTAGDSTSISSNWIFGVCDYGDGDLLVGTMQGLCVYRRADDSFRPAGGASAPPAATAVKSPRRDPEGNYWCIAGTGAILRCAGDFGTMEAFPLLREGGVAVLHALTVDARGRVIVAADSGLFVVDSPRSRPRRVLLSDPALPGGGSVDVTFVLDAGSGRYWLATRQGLYRYDAAGGSLTLASLKKAGGTSAAGRDYLFELAYDRRGRVWAAGFGGLYCYDPASRQSMSYRNLPVQGMDASSPRLYAVYVDPSEVLWAGSWRGGLWKTNLHNAQFGLIRHTPATPFPGGRASIAAIFVDLEGKIWFGDALHGITVADPRAGTFRQITSDPGSRPALSGGIVSAMAGDSMGNVWISSAQSMLDCYNTRTGAMRHLRLPVAPGTFASILSLACDREGRLWVGTEADGVYRYDPRSGAFEVFGGGGADPRVREIPSAWSFLVDRGGNVWVGGWTYNASLHRIDARTGKVTSYAQPALQSVRSMLEDTDGVLWTGSWGSGLTRFDPATGALRNYLDRDGLPSNYVKGLLRDDHGNIWISTERGLSVFSRSAETFRNYDRNDGLQGNFFYSGSCARARDGKFYFGGSEGVNGFYPDSIRAPEYTAPVVLTGFRVTGNRPVSTHASARSGVVTASYLDDILDFEFVSLDYRAPARNRYAYIMEGFNAGWIDAGTQRHASYTHLDPGEYVFKVRGTNSDGVWSPTPASLRVVITPVYWQTWWFRGALALFAVTILWLLYRYRVNRLLELERTRAAIATDLHDDIGASLTNIALFSDLAKRDILSGSGEAVRRLELIAQTSRSLLDAMNDIVWSIKPENDGLEQTILRMEDYAVSILEENGIDLHVQVPEGLRELKLPMAVRRNLFLVFKEAIGNILKHAQADAVEVSIEAASREGRQQGLRLRIRDNGRGFRAAEGRRGNGLHNMERRTQALAGSVAVTSSPGEGTTVEIWLPLNSPI